MDALKNFFYEHYIKIGLINNQKHTNSDLHDLLSETNLLLNNLGSTIQQCIGQNKLPYSQAAFLKHIQDHLIVKFKELITFDLVTSECRFTRP